MDLRARVVGGFSIDGVDTRTLGSRKARTLLQILTLARGRPVTAGQLIDHLWAEHPPARPEEQLRVLVSRLRRELGARHLVRSDAGYAFLVDWLDLDAAAAAVTDARLALAATHHAAAAVASASALALMVGEVLPEAGDAEWVEVDRALAARVAGEARRIGAVAALEAGRPAEAALLAEQALDHDPYDEVALRALMVALDRTGRSASALAAYATVRAQLADDLGVDPSPDTERLHTALLLTPGSDPERPNREPGAGVPLPGATAALPGRDEEMAALDAAWARASAGSGGLVVVEGEAGIGKSRLLATWSSHAAAGGASVLTGRCDEVAGGLPLQAVGEALADHLSVLTRDEADRVLGPSAGLVASLVGPSPSAPQPIPSARDHEAARLDLYAAVVDVLARLPAPVALVLDDVHLADPATLEWVYLAVRRAAHLSLLVVVAQRAEEARPLPAGLRLRLGPLDKHAAALIVGADRAAELVARSGGNPLFLTELAAADPDAELPASLLAAVDATCARAGAAAVTLRVAALLGPTIDIDLLVELLGLSAAAALDHVEEGVRRGLLVDDGSGIRFRHALVREALDAGVGATRRLTTHRGAAAALQARPGHDPLVVAHHARLAGDGAALAGALVDAARTASERAHQPEALALLDEAVAAADGLEVRLARARVLLVLGELARAASDADVAVGIGGGADALELGAWAAHYSRRFDEARRMADEGALVATDDDQRVRCLAIGGWTSQCVGALPEAEERLGGAVASATGPWRPLSEVWLAGLRVHQGRNEEALARLRPARIDGWLAPHSNPDLHAHLFAAIALANVGRPDDALAACEAIGQGIEDVGVARWVGRADNVSGWILRGLGELAAADERNARALEASSAEAMLEPMAHAHLDLASGHLLRDDLDAATASVDRADALGGEHAMAWRHRLRAELLRSAIARRGGDLDEARARAARVVGRASASGTRRYVVLGSLEQVRGALAAGEPVDLDAVDALVQELDHVAGVEAWRLTASLAAEAGVARWRSLAEARVVALAAHAGPHRATLERVAAVVLAGSAFGR